MRSLLKTGLADEIKLLANPYITGTGKRLFFDEMNCGLEFTGCQQLEKGVIVLSYKPANKR